MSLSEKTDEEIMELLAEYGIKHGPIVDSTRKLYEKKLEKAMAEVPEKTSSDKTYYREEEEEITYITYRSPVRHEGSGDTLKQRKIAEPAEQQDDSDKELVDDTETPILSQTTTTVNHSEVRSKQPVKRAGGCVWRMFRLLLILAFLAGVSYYVFCHVLSMEGDAGTE
ncbi:emerin (Emery-Dreifuss muscular dystrophy) [Sphaeramia orbicularis]|uniref:emerin (Emery-Dreifuss muscular dystrophy) n=1 Tax=Sphaeramia orbicularis TaxID=375764 RepID=UPI00117DC28A|nr:emerin homolog 1-like [Sphaeramia orbicularis]